MFFFLRGSIEVIFLMLCLLTAGSLSRRLKRCLGTLYVLFHLARVLQNLDEFFLLLIPKVSRRLELAMILSNAHEILLLVLGASHLVSLIIVVGVVLAASVVFKVNYLAGSLGILVSKRMHYFFLNT
jgi:hypothetical protein